MDLFEHLGHESPLPAILLFDPKWNHISLQDTLWVLPEEWKGWKFSLREVLDLTQILNEKGLWGHKRRPLLHDKIPSFEKEWKSRVSLPLVKSLVTPFPSDPHPFYPGGGSGWPQIEGPLLNLTVGCIIQRPKSDTEGRKELSSKFPELGSAPLLQRTILTKTSLPFSSDVAKFIQSVSTTVEDEIEGEIFKKVGEATSLHTTRMGDIVAGIDAILARTLSVESSLNHLVEHTDLQQMQRASVITENKARPTLMKEPENTRAMKIYISKIKGKVSNEELQSVLDSGLPLKRHRAAFQKILQDEILAQASIGSSGERQKTI
ncbi:P protein [Varroa jacobsoni rhabdovirus 2]|nr:P protein [Varroa jacobsoni rhabdovirus 2]